MFEGIFTGMDGFIQEPMLWIFFLLFFLFIIVAYKVVKILFRALLIAAISGSFPIVANVFFNIPIPITIANILWFAMLGAEVFFVYHILVSIGKFAELITKPFGRKGKKTEKIIIREVVKNEKEEKRKK